MTKHLRRSGISHTFKTLHSRSKYSLAIGLIMILFLLYIIFYRNDYRTVTSHSSEGKKYLLAFREKSPPNFTETVVLLHSDTLDSSVWEQINTIDILYKAGFRVLAIDLPGYGNSKSQTAPNDVYERAVILNTVLKQLNAAESIIVSPSMSGTYALPVVVRGSLNLRGFVPVSPFGSEQFHKGEYSMLKIPTMIIYGLGDMEYGEKSANYLQMIPDSKIHVIKDASHACYLQNPDEFHNVLLNFLNEVETGTFDSIKKEQDRNKDFY